MTFGNTRHEGIKIFGDDPMRIKNSTKESFYLLEFAGMTMRKSFLVCIFLSLLISLSQLTVRAIMQYAHPAAMPLHSLAAQFTGLQSTLAHIPRAGYYTDKNMELPLAIAQFEQAQYVLAPTVLELNNTALPLVIFDCTSPAIALAKIKTLGFQPVSANDSGIVLALNPNGAKP